MNKLFTKEVRIALVTLISLVLLYAGLNHLKGINVLKPANHYYVSIPDVPDLQISSPVYVSGFKVGIVNAMQFDYERLDGVLLQISLDKDMRVPEGSYAELKSGLTSGAYLDLKLNKDSGACLSAGDTISGRRQAGLTDQLSLEILPQAANLLPRLDSILAGIQALVIHPALTRSLNQIEAATVGLQQSSMQLNLLLARDVPAIVANLNKLSSDLSVVSGNLKEVDIQGTLGELDQTVRNINQITRQLNDSTNSLGLLLNNRSLYQHLDSAARNASDLLLDLRQQPKKYVHFSLF
jgi:phospholipid/cholesterol/gamma-HCH transport system substrate-binding protein